MALTPDFDTFARAYEAGENQIVYTRLTADLDTPVSLMLKLTGAGTHAFLLESVTGGEVRGRYSIVGMKPDLIWECRGTTSRINRSARFDEAAFEDQSGDPLANLRALIAESRIDLPTDLPAAAAYMLRLSRRDVGARSQAATAKAFRRAPASTVPAPTDTIPSTP